MNFPSTSLICLCAIYGGAQGEVMGIDANEVPLQKLRVEYPYEPKIENPKKIGSTMWNILSQR